MRCAAGYVLENPVDPPLLTHVGSVTMCEVRTTSRKDFGCRMHSENPQRPYAGPLVPNQREDEMVRHSRRREGWAVTPAAVRDAICCIATDSSEIPCQVSSDLHEWRNDLGTVSTRDSAKLHYE